MKTLTLEAGTASSLAITVASGEINFNGVPGGNRVTLSYGYFLANQELPPESSMDPEFLQDGSSRLVLRQTPDQAKRANQLQAHLVARIDAPAQMSLAQCRLTSASASVRGAHGMELELASGTLEAAENTGAYSISADSGTIRVSRPAPGFHHVIAVKAGTIMLAPGALLPLVRAEVAQGVIQGGQGRLEQIGAAGWRLVPLNADPTTSLECRAGSGSIMIG